MFKDETRENYYSLILLDDYMEGHKGFICGGCFKNIFNKEPIKDIDIFFKNLEDWNEAVNYFDELCNAGDYRFVYENPKVKAYKCIKSGMQIELCRSIFGDPKDILKQFDFTITKFAYYKHVYEDEENELHLEYRVLFDDNFFEHLHMKRLVVDDLIPFPISTFERIIRYAKYGYFPCRETKIKVLKAINELPMEAIDISQSLYDGMD